jgi:hypothetical protein
LPGREPQSCADRDLGQTVKILLKGSGHGYHYPELKRGLRW